MKSYANVTVLDEFTHNGLWIEVTDHEIVTDVSPEAYGTYIDNIVFTAYDNDGKMAVLTDSEDAAIRERIALRIMSAV